MRNQVHFTGQRMKYIYTSIKLKTLIASCFLILFYGCESKKHQEEREALVEVITITSVENSATRHYTGVIEESYSSMISFQVAGNIQQIFCDENQYIEKGQLLASLNKVILQNSYDVAYSSFKQAEDAYNRMKTLYDENSLPEIKWIEVQTNLQNARSMMNISKNNLDNCNLYAPFSGVIAKRITEIGANVMPGVPVFNLVNIETVKVKLPIPEKEVSKIKKGQKAIVRVMALGEDIQYETEVKEKGTIANPLSHTYDIKVELGNRDRKLMPGMICGVDILLDVNEKEQIIIPNNSVMIDNNNNRFVWIVNNDRASKRTVVINQFSGNGVIIKEGLKNGDEVIVNGNQKVSEGMKIKRR